MDGHIRVCVVGISLDLGSSRGWGVSLKFEGRSGGEQRAAPAASSAWPRAVHHPGIYKQNADELHCQARCQKPMNLRASAA
jgi:hypothetical protein